MYDQLESMENAAEAMLDDMFISAGKYKCFCGNIFNPFIEGGTISPNPYAIPVCPECFEKDLKEFKPVTQSEPRKS